MGYSRKEVHAFHKKQTLIERILSQRKTARIEELEEQVKLLKQKIRKLELCQ